MSTFEFGGFVSFTLAIILLFLGKALIGKFDILRRYSIPEPVIGGFLCAAAVGVAYYFFDLQVSFTLEVRDWLLLYFFAAIGLRADIRTLISGGKPLVILLALATSYILIQNLMGISLASVFGMDPKAGLMVGSISLVGGVGTALAWAPTFVDKLGIHNALELGVAANTVGLIAACVIGGPIARFLIIRHKISPKPDAELDIGVGYEKEFTAKVGRFLRCPVGLVVAQRRHDSRPLPQPSVGGRWAAAAAVRILPDRGHPARQHAQHFLQKE